jgi:hypothetical protein
MIASGRRLSAVLTLTLLAGLIPAAARADDDAGTLAQLTQCVKAAGSIAAIRACESAAVQSVRNSIPDNAIPNPLPGQYYNNLEDQEGKMMHRVADPNDTGDPDVSTPPASPDDDGN